jgi:hypothetical protein
MLPLADKRSAASGVVGGNQKSITSAHRAAVMLDAEHANKVGILIQTLKNERAIALAAYWRRNLDRWPFLVVAGELHQRDGGLIGGIGRDWSAARNLFTLACERHDDLARIHGDFSSAWFLLVTNERVDEIHEIVAEAQTCRGTA